MSLNLKTVILPSSAQLLSRVQRAQRIVDSEVLKRCDPLVPFKTGNLKRSGITGTRIGSGTVRYTAPYAKRQYYKGRVSIVRGRKWFQRMKSEQGQAILDAAQRILEGRNP